MKFPLKTQTQRLLLKWAGGLPAPFFTTLTRGDLATPFGGIGTVTLQPTAHIYQFMTAAQNAIVHAGIRLIVSGIDTVKFGVVPVDQPDAEPDFRHPAISKLNAPAPHITRGDLLWRITEGILIAGNALIIPHEDGSLECPDPRYVRWPLPGTGPPSYEVRNPFRPANARRYGAEQVAHIRHHLSPDGFNGEGVITLDLTAEAFTDQAAQRYTGTLLSRMGVPGMVATPPKDTQDTYTKEDAEQMMRQGQDTFSAGGVGKWMALAKRWDFWTPEGASAARLDLSAIRNVSEERLLAALGVHPALLGIGTGAQQTRVGNTMLAIRRSYAQNTLQPLAHLLAEQLTAEYLPFIAPPGRFRIVPNFEECIAVREAAAQAELERLEIAERAVKAGIMTPEAGRAYMGWD